MARLVACDRCGEEGEKDQLTLCPECEKERYCPDCEATCGLCDKTFGECCNVDYRGTWCQTCWNDPDAARKKYLTTHPELDGEPDDKLSAFNRAVQAWEDDVRACDEQMRGIKKVEKASQKAGKSPAKAGKAKKAPKKTAKKTKAKR